MTVEDVFACAFAFTATTFFMQLGLVVFHARRGGVVIDHVRLAIIEGDTLERIEAGELRIRLSYFVPTSVFERDLAARRPAVPMPAPRGVQ